MVFVALVVMVGVWGFGNFTSLADRESWRAGYDRDGVEYLADQRPEDAPRDSEELLRMAVFLGEQPIPPEYEQAHALIGQALYLDPVKSKVWLYAARYRMFQGDFTRARAALEYSDLLHPRHTDRRLMAVELWDLLGERQRAIDLAVQIGRTNSTSAREAARRLLWIGVRPREAFELLWRPEGSAPEVADILEGLQQPDPEAFREVLELVPEEAYEDAGFRSRLASMLSQVLVIDYAWKVWEAEDSRLSVLPGSDTEDMPRVSNLALADSPLSDRFPFGWQPFPITPDAEVYWQQGEGGGRLRLTFKSMRRPQKEFRWTFHQLPVPAHDVPIGVSVELRADVPSTSPCILIAKYGDDFLQSPRMPAAQSGSRYEVVLPPSDTPLMLRLSLGRADQEAAEAGESVMYLESLEFSRRPQP